MKDLLIEGKNICKEFYTNDVSSYILNDVNIDIYKGDFTIIMGASGAGKSTLLYSLSGMDDITSGKVEFKGKDISSLAEKEMAKIRGSEFGFVFQQANLVSNLTLFENVAVAGYVGNKNNNKEIPEKVDDLFVKLNIKNAKDRLPSKISGGEAQRAAIARAIINEPDIIFADEPTGALNKRNTEEVLNLLTLLNNEGQSILLVTHDLTAAIRGTRLLYLEDGKIIDEIKLPKYKSDDGKDRELKVSTWLTSLHW